MVIRLGVALALLAAGAAASILLRRGIRSRPGSRVGFLIVVAAALVGLTAGIARAVFPADGVASYAGCLNGSSAPPGLAGSLSNVAAGDVPLRACSSNQVLVHLSGGDITSVNPGTGLSGGGVNGATTLNIAPRYALPQGCANNFVPKWAAASSTWDCAADDNAGGTVTGVTAGAGLTGGGTSGSVPLGISQDYQLPQSCSSGQIAKADGSGLWSCGDDNASTGAAAPPHIYYVEIHSRVTTVPAGIHLAQSPAMPSILTLDVPAGHTLCRLT